jgi:hypothetical protein
MVCNWYGMVPLLPGNRNPPQRQRLSEGGGVMLVAEHADEGWPDKGCRARWVGVISQPLSESLSQGQGACLARVNQHKWYCDRCWMHGLSLIDDSAPRAPA